MKKLLFIGIFALVFSFVSTAQFTFSLKPGLSLNGASFGFKAGNIVPYAGLQFASVNTESKYIDGNYNDKSESKMNVYMPYIGVKLFFIEKGDIKAAFNTTVFKPIISEEYIDDGEKRDSDYKNSLFGGEIGFVSEYYFSEQFSIGGEFGYRYGIFKSEYDGDNSSIVSDDKLNLNMTYFSASLNYYF